MTPRLNHGPEEKALHRQRQELKQKLIRRRLHLGLDTAQVSVLMGRQPDALWALENRYQDARMSRWQRWAWALGLHLRVSYDIRVPVESDPYHLALLHMFERAEEGTPHFFAVERALAMHVLTLVRQARGLTAQKAAGLMGMHHSSISAWENSPTQDPMLHPLQRYAHHLGAPADFLLIEREGHV